MAGCQDLSAFEGGGAREMGHSISEVAMEFGFSRTTISRVFREYWESGKISNHIKSTSLLWPENILQERNQRQLTRIIKHNRRATLPQIAADFNAGPSTSVTVRNIQRNIIDIGFRSRRLNHVPLLAARHKGLRLAWPLQHRYWAVNDWKHVMRFDESRFQLKRADGLERV
ncbi:HTH_Tnp_Tc3_2 domain-containing protein [Trichonephila clavipes]|nr:HTH_Tnp_Tc3_2 domain-containing protein [Trichonephila clavipes]